MGELQTIFDLLAKPEFWTGALLGLAGAGLLFVSTSLAERLMAGWGLVFALAVLSAVAIRFDGDSSLLMPFVVIVAVGLVVDVAYSSSLGRAGLAIKVVAWGLATATVWFVSVGVVDEPSWAPFGLAVAVVALGAGLWGLGRTSESDLAGPLLAIAVAGAWVTVPETGMLVVMLGAALPMGLVTLRPVGGRASVAGALGLAALFSWLVLDGGLARAWTIEASWAAAALIPLTALILRYDVARPGRLLILVTQLVYVAVITRVADHTESAMVVLVASAVALILAGLVLVIVPANLRIDEPVRQ